ncbi:hypothetical protein Fcan01_10455 [Folsomia candida]|uniref:Gustatory receptor n=1 Tax=Folsomia candida TaxID=158441 RepID=A0A226E9H1_FOLCA|nr:hypothetical protein Fcan01_10455 [Folsomia candida]
MMSLFFKKRFENLVLIPLNILYYMVLYPYKISKHLDHESIQISEIAPCNFHHLVEKIFHTPICAGTHILALFVYCSEAVQSHVSRTSNNPLDYLRLLMQSCTCVHHFNFVHLIWTRKSEFVRLIKQYGSKSCPGHDTEFQFYLNYAVYMILLYARIMLSYSTDTVIFCLVLLLYLAIRSYYEILLETRITNETSFASALTKYFEACKLIELMNETFARVMLTYVLEAFSFYAVYLKEIAVFDGQCAYMKVKMTLSFLLICSVFYFCAEIVGMMDKAKFILINSNLARNPGSHLDLISIRVQLSTHSYGLSGNGFFLINYSFVSAVCNTLLTYFIISVQFQSKAV